jgi:hypothetical protein
MIIPASVFSLVILTALVLVVAAPLILVVLLWRDWRGKRLW